jgi:DNA repair exonuclease SbcCD ATPase subunit
MIEDIETRLAAVAGLVREAELLRGRRAELDRRHAEHAAAVTELRQRWAGEVRDVERLESLSLSRVLAALRGAQAEELSRERAEADAARYRVAEGESRLAAIRAERATVEARLTALADLPARFAAVIDDKERHLRRSGGPPITRLLALAEERGRVEAELRELHEAGGAAEAALGALGELRRRLDLASGRQTADNLLGGVLAVGLPN